MTDGNTADVDDWLKEFDIVPKAEANETSLFPSTCQTCCTCAMMQAIQDNAAAIKIISRNLEQNNERSVGPGLYVQD